MSTADKLARLAELFEGTAEGLTRSTEGASEYVDGAVDAYEWAASQARRIAEEA